MTAVGTLRVRTDLDDTYLDRWAGDLGVRAALDAARREAADAR